MQTRQLIFVDCVCNTYCGCLFWIKGVLCEPQQETVKTTQYNIWLEYCLIQYNVTRRLNLMASLLFKKYFYTVFQGTQTGSQQKYSSNVNNSSLLYKIPYYQTVAVKKKSYCTSAPRHENGLTKSINSLSRKSWIQTTIPVAGFSYSSCLTPRN